MPYQLVFFDLDGTLTPSKSAMPPSVSKCFLDLLAYTTVSVISGGDFSQFKTQLLDSLVQGETSNSGNCQEADYQNLHLLPTCGTQYWLFEDGRWECQYSKQIPGTQAKQATVLVEKTARELGFWVETPWGKIIENRGSQITYSALGQQAPLDKKVQWDPTGDKRNQMVAILQEQLPELSVRAGGSTSVDITLKGVDKAYGINALLDRLSVSPKQALFVGDRLDPQGNDFPAISTGVDTLSTDGWEDTQRIIHCLLDS